MALEVIFESPYIVSEVWHVGKPTAKIETVLAMSPVEYVFANGEELERIKQRMPNIPHTHQHCKWRGEMAQFIADNFSQLQ